MIGELSANFAAITLTIATFMYMKILIKCSPRLLNLIKDSYAQFVLGLVIVFTG